MEKYYSLWIRDITRLTIRAVMMVLWLSLSVFANDSDSAPNSTHQAMQYSVGYWNDNFLYEPLLGSLTAAGDDDYITASLWGQIARISSPIHILLDCYLNILTNNTENYRVDLLTIRLSRVHHPPWGLFVYGAGFLTYGNYGGAALQQAYHTQFNLAYNKLPYFKDRQAGLLAHGRVEYLLIDRSYFNLYSYSGLGIRTNSSPENIRTGLTLTGIYIEQKSPVSIQGELRGGYIHYFNLEYPMASLFDAGFMWGYLLSVGINQKFELGFWFTENQYGGKNPQFGVACSFPWDGKHSLGLSQSTFP